MKLLKEVLEKTYDNPTLRKSIVPLFLGDPGLGKTVLIQQFAEERGVKVVEFITSQRNPFEISGMAMPDRDLKKMAIWDFDTMLEMKDGDILFFDELLNGNPTVLNACLTLIEQRTMISGKKLPDIMIVAAANPQGMSPLTPQIKERFIWYNVKFNQKMWTDYMMDKYDLPADMCEKFSRLIKEEEFVSNNFYTPRSIDKAVNMLINNVPTPYKSSINPVLNTLYKNPFKEEVVLSKTKTVAPGEMVSWLDLVKLKIKNEKISQ